MTDPHRSPPGASPEHRGAAAAHLPPGPAPTASEQRAALVRLVVVVAAGLFAAAITGTSKTVAVMLAVVAMIMLHELGHFLTAKWAGMKVTEYFLGFGPRLWSVRRGETEYGVKAIPAGGYVKILGMSNLEEVDPADEARTYRQKPYWRRLSVGVAGSAMHFLLAFVLLWVLNGFVGFTHLDEPLPVVGAISRLETGQSPAQAAGLEPGDRIVAIDGRPVGAWEDLPEYVRPRVGQPIEFTIERDGSRLTRTITPIDLNRVAVPGRPAPPADAEPQGFVGVSPAYRVEKTNPVTALGRAGGDFVEYMGLTLKGLASIASPEGLRSYGEQLGGSGPAVPEENSPRFLSPVGLVRIAGVAARSGIEPVLILLLSINLFVGVFNLVPLLPLDGGHVAIATYERLRSRRGRPYHADVAKLLPLTYAVFLLLVFLGLTSLYLDVFRPLSFR